MTSIKLLGVSSESYIMLKEVLKQVLETIETNVPVEEVNVIDEILKYEIEAIPAILVDDQVRFEKKGHIPDKNELVKLLKNKY